MPKYTVYGLKLQTVEPIRGLAPVADHDGRAIDVSFQRRRPDESLDLSGWTQVEPPESRRRRRISTFVPADGAGSARLLYLRPDNFGDTWCVYDADRSRIDVHYPHDLTYEDCCSYFLGSMLGMVLRVGGAFALHASAVCLDNEAVIFIGRKRAGKSTTAAALAFLRGGEVLCDDIAVIDQKEGEFHVRRAYGGVRLHADAFARIPKNGNETVLPVYSFVDKNYVFPDPAEGNDKKQKMSAPIKAIYVLGERREDADGPARIVGLKSAEAIPALTANTYAAGAVTDSAAVAGEFRLIGRLAQRVPVFELANRSTLDRLDELSRQILEHSLEIDGS